MGGVATSESRAADMPLVVAIDGPSGVGKSTVARLVAKRLDVAYLDTGAMYRCVALESLRHGLPDSLEEADLEPVLEDLELELESTDDGARLRLRGEPVGDEIRTSEVSERTSRIAVLPSVRRVLLERQRSFGTRLGGVLEGRDIGTKVFPDAPFKFFLDADLEVRAERRFEELRRSQPDLSLEKVRAELEARDRRDRERVESPLVRTRDHLLIDTGSTDAEGVAERIVQFVHAQQ